MRQITVYNYEELPTEQAKEKAREWWIKAELECPAWQDDHFKSMGKAIELIQLETNIKKIKKLSSDCKLTGYCADYLLSKLIRLNKNKLPTDKEIENFYISEFEKEVDDNISNVSYVEENIIINEYDFLEDGRRL